MKLSWNTIRYDFMLVLTDALLDLDDIQNSELFATAGRCIFHSIHKLCAQ